MASIPERCSRPHDADLMVSKLEVGVRDIYLGHVAGHTILGGYRTRGSRMISGRFGVRCSLVTTKASLIVKTGFAHQRLVRVVTGDASYAGIALTPALAAFQPVRLKSRVPNSGRA
jgi:hypothetical protein